MDMTSLELVAEAETARTTGHRSARSARVEVLTRAEPRRSWTAEQKREIVAESLGPDLTPTEVARKYRISSGQLYTWRQQLLRLHGAPDARLRFAAVELMRAAPPALASSPASERPALTPAPPAVRPEGLIEIQLPCGVSLRVDAHVDGRALRRVLEVLESR
jgi:transposase